MIEVIKYNGIDTFKPLADLADAITKVVPSIKLESEDMTKYGIDLEQYPKGVAMHFRVFHDTDTNNHIGQLSVENWNSKTPKFGIQSINIDDGRTTWGDEGQYKTSIHAKNIVRVAKKVFKPFTFEQIAKKNYQRFHRAIDNIRSSASWDMRNKTCNDFEIFIADLQHLSGIGYQPISPKIKKMMEYATENKDHLDKYLRYNPDHYFVLVKENMVQYAKVNGENKHFSEPITTQSKDQLPDEIKGKLFVLDITESKDFVEDIGLKENDGAYWIIA